MPNLYQWLKLITCSYTCCTNVVQKIITMCKKDDRSPHQKSRFFISSKGVGLSLDAWPSRKTWKHLYALRVYACY